jgi:hypothetical protein
MRLCRARRRAACPQARAHLKKRPPPRGSGATQPPSARLTACQALQIEEQRGHDQGGARQRRQGTANLEDGQNDKGSIRGGNPEHDG